MKSWYSSKTVWIALLQALIGVLTLVAGVTSATTPLSAAGITLLFKSLLDIYIRFQTDTGLFPPLQP